MAYRTEKFQKAFQALQENNTDWWIIAGEETATTTDPSLDAISDSGFIGRTAIIFSKDEKVRVICTPIDIRMYEQAGVFEECTAFPVSFEDTLVEYIHKYSPHSIALNYSETYPEADGLSAGMKAVLERALAKAAYTGTVTGSEKIVQRIRK